MKRTFSKTDIVERYVKKYPTLPSLSLARVIYKEQREHFKDIEQCRTATRYIRGVQGTKQRKYRKSKSHLFVKPFSLNPYNLPKSYEEKPKIFTLPKEHNNILLISDLHVPFHSIPALTEAIKYGKENNINTIFINGDLIDFYQISRFTCIEKKRNTKEELEAAREVLSILRTEFPKAAFYLLEGNHDKRMEMYLATKAPELLGTPEFQLEHLLQSEFFNLKIIPDNTLVKMGKLFVTHGHLLIRGVFAPVNSARGAFLKAKASVLISHVHKVSQHSETTLKGDVITCYSTGCLCELSPTYNPFGNNFSHGFAHIKVNPDSTYKVRNYQIIEGKLY